MKKKTIDELLLYKVSEIELVDETRIMGWLVPKGDGYLILPIYDFWNTYKVKASHIKSAHYRTNNFIVLGGEDDL